MLLYVLIINIVLVACGGLESNQTDEGEIANDAEQETNMGDPQTDGNGITSLRLATSNVGGTGYM